MIEPSRPYNDRKSHSYGEQAKNSGPETRSGLDRAVILPSGLTVPCHSKMPFHRTEPLLIVKGGGTGPHGPHLDHPRDF